MSLTCHPANRVVDVVYGQAAGVTINPRHNGCEIAGSVYLPSDNYGRFSTSVVGEGHVQVSGTQQLRQDNNKYTCGDKRLLILYTLSSCRVLMTTDSRDIRHPDRAFDITLEEREVTQGCFLLSH